MAGCVIRQSLTTRQCPAANLALPPGAPLLLRGVQHPGLHAQCKRVGAPESAAACRQALVLTLADEQLHRLQRLPRCLRRGLYVLPSTPNQELVSLRNGNTSKGVHPYVHSVRRPSKIC